MDSNKVNLFDIEFDSINMAETVELVDENIQLGKGLHLLGVNADKINEINNNERLKKICEEAEIINADGASVILASKLLGKPLPERVAGIDLMQELLELANKKKYPVYFIGAKNEVVSTMVKKLEKKYKNLRIAGYRDGYFKESEWPQISEQINQSGAKLVFIGITSPIKEYFIDFLLKNESHAVLMGVGGSFDVLSGKIKRAPEWMQKSNLEWLYRVSQEPKRLFKRYFVGNTIFIGRIIKEKVNAKK
ncbi:WecB/TagA/CpsF family glycosyltransferase [Pediococcus acidilactici]|uniref:WecB/TagA/CpsF family glycosyltransferase n=1 Tax=Pediococcus acidilactici TaxID=1254 RepID=UPI0013233183|nr:WecB/TagA/CpsF family glycosyltransferase [Pediococcus acidilactici]KAF0370178.1 WecB/TagA/CpsF family glycosyltransferase [Pediococcus acidilactici]KAF0381951.1 WecB/TagA/CpsF family glycosyltransferase [Pediococcus acidilactici]KAF0455155.1 WecB/TagA/CpsF family glycosyltransferase [Pediococcus acidilactici]KAF0477310.1 WecB/TagA/CpsF family glycosyltransferase [Pediococcus acidilactici]KAF0538100.1 WecB/TagA/CpsF family glycosyltransferase [Pediococcus acidilactici]